MINYSINHNNNSLLTLLNVMSAIYLKNKQHDQFIVAPIAAL